MEYLIFIGAVAAFLVFVFVQGMLSARRREREYLQALRKNYGTAPDREYSVERFDRMGTYYRRRKAPPDIDDITWNDLGMDDVFRRLNTTQSAIGEEYLYALLRRAVTSPEELAHREDVIRFFQEREDQRVKVQFLFHRLGYMGKYSLYDYLEHLDHLGERSNLRHIVCDLLFLPLIALLPFQTAIAAVLIAALMVYNIVKYFGEKKEIEPYILSFSYVMQLLDICEKLRKTAIPVCPQEWEQLRRHTVNLERIRFGSFLLFGSYRGGAAGSPLDAILDYVRMVFHLDLIQFNRMLDGVRRHTEDVDGLVEVVGFLESAIAIAGYRASLKGGYCVPEHIGAQTGDRVKLEIRDGCHPLIENGVRNSVTADSGVLITGSNASGKSTFLKMVAINAVFSQTIHTVLAERYQAPIYHIYSSMALRDDVVGGESYYMVEIRALKRILDAADRGETVLCFVDEVLRGTNTVERIAASTQILRSLTKSGVLAFAATHDIELTYLLEKEYTNYHFEEEMREGDIIFPYRLMQGRSATRNAILLLRSMGYEDAIVDEASRSAEEFMRSGKWEC